MVSRIVKPKRESPGRTLLPSEVDEMLNHSIGPSEYRRNESWSELVVRHYRWNLSRMVSMARDAGAEIVFIAPAANLRDCSPFKSESGRGLSSQQVAETGQSVASAIEDLLEDRFEEALAKCQAVLAKDGDYADAHYYSGCALYALDRFDEATKAFRLAVDNDVCPLRATSQISDAIRGVARRDDVPLVDFEKLAAEKCELEYGHRCVGGELFLDHVHPTIETHRDLALEILRLLQRRSLLGDTGSGPDASPSTEELRQVAARIESKIDRKAQGIAFRNLAKVLHWAGKFQEAEPRARDALRLLPTDAESRFLLADCLVQTGRPDEAIEQYRQLLAVTDYSRAHLPFGELLAETGDYRGAKSYLLRAVLTDNEEHRVRAYRTLGWVHQQLGETAFAAESFRIADEISGQNPAAAPETTRPIEAAPSRQ